MLPDLQLKKERGYTDPKTKVWPDGREKLVGRDWLKRKKEIWDRGQGRCEKIVSTKLDARWEGLKRITTTLHERCANEMHDPHHIVKRSELRDDRAANLIGLCRQHHNEEDNRKIGARRDVAQPSTD